MDRYDTSIDTKLGKVLMGFLVNNLHFQWYATDAFPEDDREQCASASRDIRDFCLSLEAGDSPEEALLRLPQSKIAPRLHRNIRLALGHWHGDQITDIETIAALERRALLCAQEQAGFFDKKR
jgi:hypothetical protein